MALAAVVRQRSVIGGKRPRVKKFLGGSFVKKPNGEKSADECHQADDESCPSPCMQFVVIAEIAFVTLGDLLLRASGFGYRRSVIKQRHVSMPEGQHEQKEGNRRVHKEPGVQPVMQFRL